jgi:hypothetical protein
VRASARALLLACAFALPVAVGAACTAGNDIAYASDGGGSDDAARIVRESSTDVVAPALPVPLTPSPNGLPCELGIGPGSGCESAAGLGCCVRSGAPKVCVEQWEYYQHAPGKCDGAGSVFVSCLQGDNDNACCWGVDGTSNTRFTRYRADCGDAGPPSCDPAADGGSCPNGEPCKAITCNGQSLGYCGNGAPPCP